MSKLAINGGEPVRKNGFSSWPIHDKREEEALIRVVRTGNWQGGIGNEVKEFEQEFANYQGAKYGICMTNGTATLIIGLKVLGIKKDDEVIIPASTFTGVPMAILLANAIPVFVDLDPANYYCISPESIEKAITDKTKAIMPVHNGGVPADMDNIMEIARKYKLKVIEDSAHAHGSEWDGTRVGAIGNLGSFSFQTNKCMISGDGGIIVTNSKEMASLCYSYREFGRIKEGFEHEEVIYSGNYRMTEFQAAVLRVQLKRLDEQIRLRTENAKYLTACLSEIDGIKPIKIHSKVTRHSWYQYIMRYDKDKFNGLSKERFIQALSAEGILCVSFLEPLYNMPLFKKGLANYKTVPCPQAEKAYQEGIWFSHTLLLGKKEDMNDIVCAIKKIKQNIKEII